MRRPSSRCTRASSPSRCPSTSARPASRSSKSEAWTGTQRPWPSPIFWPTVTAIEARPHPGGNLQTAIVIESDGRNTLCPTVKPRDPEAVAAMSAEDLIAVIREAGITGMGGAGFPTSVKLSSGLGKVDTVIVNGAECEPYITSDDRLMRETPERVVGGLRVVLQILQPKRAAIGIEQNKPEAIAAISAVLGSGIDLLPLHVRYPQGAEKQLIQTVTGRCVPPGGLPAHVGCAVFNAATCAAIYDAVYLGLPLVRRAVTVTGSAIAKPGNFLAPIGTAYSDLVEAAGGFALPPYKVLCGGPMMGIAQYTLRTATIKGNNALTCYSDKDRHETPNPHCIRCGKCVEACPMHLMPLFLHRAVNRGDLMRRVEFGLCACGEEESVSFRASSFISRRPPSLLFHGRRRRARAFCRCGSSARAGCPPGSRRRTSRTRCSP